jgi:ribosomal protein L20
MKALVFLLLLPCFALAADTVLPPAKEMKKQSDDYSARIRKENKIKFRELTIEKIKLMSCLGKYMLTVEQPKDKQLYEDFLDELKKQGYKTEFQSNMIYISWGSAE